MKQTPQKQLTYWLSVIIIGITLGLALQFVRAWTEPPAGTTPPNGNVGAPINTSATAQTKAGGLNIGGKLKVGNDAQPQVAGQIRWSGLDFEGFDGTAWKSFTATGGGGTPATHIMYQCPNTGDTGCGYGRCWNCNGCWGQLGDSPTCEVWSDCTGGGGPMWAGGCTDEGARSCWAVLVPN